MVELNWTREAQNWLEDIYEYISQDNPEAAQETIDSIYEKAQLLRDYPKAGSRYEASDKHIRILLYGHYRITYWIRSEEQIDIVGVFHGAMDIEEYLS